MIGSLLCLLVPVLGGCTEYSEYVPAIAQVERNEQFYSGKRIDVIGRVEGLNQWSSRTGESVYQAFFVCNGPQCIHVLIESRMPVRGGELVAVRGRYFHEYRTARSVVHNEIEASEVLPRE
jgi:hypothetical protein